jgi:hypothetical protein
VRMGLSWIKFVPIVANSGRFACARTAARQCLGRETQTWANQDDADPAPISGYCRLPYYVESVVVVRNSGLARSTASQSTYSM